MTSIVEVYRRWPTHTDCIRHLERVRWAEKPICPYCGADKVSRHREMTRDDRWQCTAGAGCGRSFSVTVGTIFHKTHIDLQRWFLLIALMLSAKKGLSSMQAARDLDVRQPTAWSMMHRARKALADDGALLAGIVEMDEAYVGGKPRKRNRRDDDDNAPRGRATGKTPVVGAVERGGRVKAKVGDPAKMAAADMAALVQAMIDCRRAVVPHRRINHSREYLRRDLFSGQFGAIHTNTIEGFWAIVKRAVYGQFHRVSRKYLPLYLREITWRYNARLNGGGLDDLLHLAVKPQTV